MHLPTPEVLTERMTDVADLAITRGRVATLEIRRPPNNFFDLPLIQELVRAVEDLAADGECRAVVLCSEGKHFCAGADFRRGERRLLAQSVGMNFYDVAAGLFDQPLPMVAAIQGGAIG